MDLVFDHIGLITEEKKEGENWIENTKVWVTDPNKHPYRVEWLRYAPDSPVRGPLRERPHISFRVKSIKEASKGLKVLLEPFNVGGFARVGFFEYHDGTVVEFMEYFNKKGEWFPEQNKK